MGLFDECSLAADEKTFQFLVEIVRLRKSRAVIIEVGIQVIFVRDFRVAPEVVVIVGHDLRSRKGELADIAEG